VGIKPTTDAVQSELDNISLRILVNSSSDEELIRQKCGAILMTNYALNIGTSHQRHTHICFKILTLLLCLPERKSHRENHA